MLLMVRTKTAIVRATEMRVCIEGLGVFRSFIVVPDFFNRVFVEVVSKEEIMEIRDRVRDTYGEIVDALVILEHVECATMHELGAPTVAGCQYVSLNVASGGPSSRDSKLTKVLKMGAAVEEVVFDVIERQGLVLGQHQRISPAAGKPPKGNSAFCPNRALHDDRRLPQTSRLLEPTAWSLASR